VTTRTRSRSRQRARLSEPTAPRRVVDGFLVGVRDAAAGVAKVGSVEWGERGLPAVAWFDYCRGYDGAPARRSGR
jgi:hypothetical protein